MMLPITVIVAVKNEALNISRCLASLQPAEATYVIDSQSTDGTAEIAKSAGATVVQFSYPGGGSPRKRQWAMNTLPITSPWVMLIDADELVTPQLWAEIGERIQRPEAVAFDALKLFHFMGRRFRFGGFSHSAVILFRRGNARFEQPMGQSNDGLDMEVHERLLVDGPVERLQAPLIHDDFKGLAAYIDRHNRYSTWEADFRSQLSRGDAKGVAGRLFGNVQERRRLLKRWAMRMPFEATAWFLYHYVVRFGFLEGRRGLIAAQIRRSYIEQVRAKRYEATVRGSPDSSIDR